MTPSPGSAFLHVSILAGLVLACSAKAPEKSSNCSEQITVHRHTSYRVRVGHQLRINCTVEFCEDSRLKVTWYKDYITLTADSERIWETWVKLKSEGVSFLNITNIQLNDSGRYHCAIDTLTVGHAITIFVYSDNDTSGPTEDGPEGSPSKPSTYTDSVAALAAIIVAVIVIVIAVIVGTVLMLRARRGRAEKTPKAGNLYISMEDRAKARRTPRGELPAPPRAPGRDLMEVKSETAVTHEAEDATEEKDKQEEEEEEEASIVYASLYHQQPPRGRGRPPKPSKEEPSVYASLRVP